MCGNAVLFYRLLRAAESMQADGQLDVRAVGERTLIAHAEPVDAIRYNQVGQRDHPGFEAYLIYVS